jgi:diguanylate cyclase (GGDEF)-like protein/PAS domain S-box-containing protein
MDDSGIGETRVGQGDGHGAAPVSANGDGLATRLLEAAPDAIVGVDADGRIMFANARTAELFGYERNELLGQSVEILVPETRRELHATHRRGYVESPRARPMGEVGARLHGRRKDGTELAVEISLSPLGGDETTSVIAVVRDVTERERVEAELRRTYERLAEAQRLARLGSWEWDIPANEVTWSEELFRIYGLEPGEVVPSYEGFLERVHPDDRDSVDARNRKAFADHQPFEDVKRCLRPDGTLFLMRTQGEVITDGAGAPLKMIGVCEDVTVEKLAEEASAKLSEIVRGSADAIIATSPEGFIEAWNPAAEALYGYTAQEAIGNSFKVLVRPEEHELFEDYLEQLRAGEQVGVHETLRVRRDGSLIDVSVSWSAVRDGDGEVIALSTIARDVTERKRFESQLKQLANYDPLTGLMNRARFEEELDGRVTRTKLGRGAGGAVLLLDLDNFKYVNDTFGHGAGDELVRTIGALLGARMRESDVIARLGGDEFALLLPESDPAGVRRIADELIAAVREYSMPIDGRAIQVTTSIGGALFDQASQSGEELLADADRALYQAKNAGRDRAVIEPLAAEPGSRRRKRLSWEHRIRDALESDLFELHAQPILNLRNNEISQHELLLRMRNGDDLVPPGSFLGVAERLGLIHAIDRWVVGEAIELLARAPELRLEVNLSGRSMDDAQLLQMIQTELARNAVDPTRLTFEITETAAIASMDRAQRLAVALRNLGCRFALDDFGAGFGSFYYLKHMPTDYLKIDGDFITTPRSRTDDLVVESIVRIARGLGQQTIAEMVEDAGTLEVMRDHGVDLAQGFYIGRPEPVGELVGALAVARQTP